MKYRWKLAEARLVERRRLQESLGVGELMATCLLERGQCLPEEAEAYLNPRLRSLGDPEGFAALPGAVNRLWQARENGEGLVLFGDYDVDGVTATALLTEVLGKLGWRVGQYLPDRFSEGYGLTQLAAENCRARHPDATLWLAVDCGSTSVGPIAWLRTQGVETMVLDHHQTGPELPEAVAMVNPVLGDRWRELCSVGLAFRLAHALVKRGRREALPGFAEFDLRFLLDLVALGTVADLVPLTGENRILVQAGMERLGQTVRPGLMALKEVAGVEAPVRVEQIGFQMGPRLNAAGRLEQAQQALDLLLADSLATARPLATALDVCNRERQIIERRVSEAAIQRVKARFDPARDYVIVESDPEWHIGVVGIVASRVLREFHRPTLIVGGQGVSLEPGLSEPGADPASVGQEVAKGWRGSGRSIAGFDLAAALRGCDDLLLKHGGHRMAAGVTVRPEQVNALRERLNRIAQGSLTAEQLVPELRLDATVRLKELTEAVLGELARLEPFGQGNPSVQVALPGVRHARPPARMGKEQQHWRFTVTDGTGQVDCVWWNAGTRPVPVGEFDLAGVPEINEYQGRRSVRFKVIDWREAGAD
jgi:single-stranded-DNA-specific exonuclease